MVGGGWVTHGAPMDSPQNHYATIVLICQVFNSGCGSNMRVSFVNYSGQASSCEWWSHHLSSLRPRSASANSTSERFSTAGGIARLLAALLSGTLAARRIFLKNDLRLGTGVQIGRRYELFAGDRCWPRVAEPKRNCPVYVCRSGVCDVPSASQKQPQRLFPVTLIARSSWAS